MISKRNLRVALDAMGGDRAPRVVVEGAVKAAESSKYNVILVGDNRKINKFLKFHDYPKDRLFIEHASQKVKMGEAAAVSVRKKRDSSIAVGMRLMKENKADVFVSAGNTGAVVVSATLKLRLLPKVERPGIGILLPSLKDPILVIDAGANINSTPMQLYQYAVMGTAYAKYMLKYKKPNVGLLNIGQEESKGIELVKGARAILEKTNLDFVGNVEARDIFSGEVNIIVCDGFVGNIVLKVAEGLAEASGQLLKRELNKALLPKIGAILSLPAYRAVRKQMDYSEYGGAPLLGVDGAVIIGHGSSNAKAIKNAVFVAGEYVEHKVNAHIVEMLEENEEKVKGVLNG